MDLLPVRAGPGLARPFDLLQMEALSLDSHSSCSEIQGHRFHHLSVAQFKIYCFEDASI